MTRRRAELLWLALPIPARLTTVLLGAALAGFVLLAFLSGCATPPEGVQITVSEEKAAQCQAAGGCGPLSLAQILAMLQTAHDAGAAEALESLDSQGCRKGAVALKAVPMT